MFDSTASQPPVHTTIPTTVFTGFLGSGKTTIIAHLIDALQSHGEQVIYIKNEIGDEDVDGAIMRGKNIKSKELLNGCICCTLVGPFHTAIDEIITSFQPDRIIIEASGAADPSAIAIMIDGHPGLLRDGIISVVDVVNFDGYIDLSQTARNQTRFTDIIVFNKIELVDTARKQAVVGYVRELNDHSPIVEAPEGVLNPAVAFGISSQELSDLLQQQAASEQESVDRHNQDHSHAENHLQIDGIETTRCSIDTPPTRGTVQKFLEHLPPQVFRVKGIIELDSGELVLVNKVGARFQVTPAPPRATAKPYLVLIGFKLSALPERIMFP